VKREEPLCFSSFIIIGETLCLSPPLSLWVNVNLLPQNSAPPWMVVAWSWPLWTLAVPSLCSWSRLAFCVSQLLICFHSLMLTGPFTNTTVNTKHRHKTKKATTSPRSSASLSLSSDGTSFSCLSSSPPS